MRDTRIVTREPPLGELARRVGSDLDRLARGHVELARLEITASVRAVAADAISALVSAVVVLIGFGLLLLAGVAALAPLVPALWLRLLIAAVVYLLVGGTIAASFVRKLRGELPAPASGARRETAPLVEQPQHG